MPDVIFNGPEGRLEGRYQHAKRDDAPVALADYYDADVEAAVRAAYQRDYMMFGFGAWRG